MRPQPKDGSISGARRAVVRIVRSAIEDWMILAGILSPFAAILCMESVEFRLSGEFLGFWWRLLDWLPVVIGMSFCVTGAPRRYSFLLAGAVAFAGLCSMIGASGDILRCLFYTIYISGVLWVFDVMAERLRSHEVVGAIALVVLLGLSAQIVLFSQGYVSFRSEVTGVDVGVEGSVIRSGTTVGAATATGVAVTLLVGLVVSGFRGRHLVQLVAVVLGGVGLFMIAARGGLICVLLMGVFVGWDLFARRKHKLLLGLLGGGVLVILYLGLVEREFVFRSMQNMLERTQYGVLDDSGRFVRYTEALTYFFAHPLGGSGFGSYYFRSSVDAGSPYSIIGATSPHNVYLLLLAEAGLGGAVAGAAFAFLPVYLWIKRNTAGALILAIVLWGLCNVEVCLLEAPFLPLMALLISMEITIAHAHGGRRPTAGQRRQIPEQVMRVPERA